MIESIYRDAAVFLSFFFLWKNVLFADVETLNTREKNPAGVSRTLLALMSLVLICLQGIFYFTNKAEGGSLNLVCACFILSVWYF